MSARWTQADVDRVNRTRPCKPAPKIAGSVSKYSNVKTGSYASKREAKRAEELKLLEAAGKITNLREQVTFELIPKQEGERACKYVADFAYSELVDGEIQNEVVEDVKGFRNRVYLLKKKLMLHVHGIRVRES